MTKLLAVYILFLSFNVHSASWKITFPHSPEHTSTIEEYPVQLLSLALEQTGVNYQLKPSKKILGKLKALAWLKDNREINVVWAMTTAQREMDLLPIRIPIFKGLIGWRLLLIRKDMADRFKYIQQLEHLIKLSPLQVRDWPDTKILQSNGFDVISEQTDIELMDKLVNAQGDFFPRSIVDVWEVLTKSGLENKIQVQPSLGIRYPAAMYFFVNKKSVPLANLIEKGLEKAIENGQFQALFIENYRNYIEVSHIEKRTFYRLENSFLPEKTPLNRKELWFDGKLYIPQEP